MKNISLSSNLTWRDIATRVILTLGTVAIIVWFMPRDTQSTFKVEMGKVWRYSDLTAPFDFPIYKSEETLKAECDSALLDYEPYYTLDKEVGEEKVRSFLHDFAEDFPDVSADNKIAIANRLNYFYEKGIIDTKEPIESEPDTAKTLRVVKGKTAISLPVKETFTAVQAYELLMNDESLKIRGHSLSELSLNDYIIPNLIYDRERSEASKQELISTVPKASGVAQRGQKIIDRGTLIDEEKFLMLESYQKENERRNQDSSQITTTIAGEVLYVLLLVTGFTLFLSIFRDEYFEKMRSLGMIYSLIVLFSVITSLMVSHNMLHVYIIPFAIVPIFISVFIDSRTAFVAHTTLVLICACILQQPFNFIAVQVMAGITVILTLRDLSSRSQLLWTALLVSIVSCLINLALDFIHTNSISNIDASPYTYLFICGIVLFCSYPIVFILEKTFGYTSNITLIELSDMNKELLRRMSEVAPGTFNHSIQVSNLAAAIARKLDANTQLVRTGALYHDIGKTVNPIYYTENQSGGINPHEQLSCIESAQMIISHVTEGLKLAEKYNIPDSVKNFIATHHGQGKAKFFYVKYKNEHPDENVDDLLFTYPGPNPFTKEQAILMMADSVEAASRSLPDYTEKSVRELVNRIIDQQVADGFFRECPITFRDIQYAKTVLIEKLKTIYHTRISYPELKKE
jgi:putative nucleotidyltransferase with HDIG domain